MSMILYILFALLAPIHAFFFDFGGGGHQQNHQNEPAVQYEDNILNTKCKGYVCPATLKCVSGPGDCPCEFPKSQLRCILPNGQSVCISKPAVSNPELIKLYDDPIKGPRAKNAGVRDCGWVEKAYYGKV